MKVRLRLLADIALSVVQKSKEVLQTMEIFNLSDENMKILNMLYYNSDLL